MYVKEVNMEAEKKKLIGKGERKTYVLKLILFACAYVFALGTCL